jgi:Tol biopolymer transport system component
LILQYYFQGGANWAPFFLPDGRRIIFSSDHGSTQGFGAFDLYVLDENGDLEQVISNDAF